MKIYTHPRCSTCKEVIKDINSKNIKYELIDLTTEGILYNDIKKYHEISGLEIKKFFNTSGMKYRELNLKEKLTSMSLDDCYKILSKDGMLVKRPLITNDIEITLGRKNSDIWIK